VLARLSAQEGCPRSIGRLRRASIVPRIFLFGSDARMQHKAFGDVRDPPPRSWPDVRGFAKYLFQKLFSFFKLQNYDLCVYNGQISLPAQRPGQDD
jgi:hypothetical protein